jgi:hypothetical protein
MKADGQIETWTETERRIDRQTGGQTDTHSQSARQRDVYAGMKANGKIERETNRWTESERERASDRKKD